VHKDIELFEDSTRANIINVVFFFEDEVVLVEGMNGDALSSAPQSQVAGHGAHRGAKLDDTLDMRMIEEEVAEVVVELADVLCFLSSKQLAHCSLFCHGFFLKDIPPRVFAEHNLSDVNGVLFDAFSNVVYEPKGCYKECHHIGTVS
jgi:hypothetical protein